MIALAKPSIAESRPKPISATEPRESPARIATRALERHVRQAQPTTAASRARRAGGTSSRSTAAPGRAGGEVGSAGRAHARHRHAVEDGVEQRAAGVGERVHDHLAVAAAARPAGRRAARAGDGDEVLRALADPGQVADAQLVGRGERRRASVKPRRIAQRLRALGQRLRAASARRSARSRSAFGRSRQSRSQRSSAMAPSYQRLKGY